ncbi:MAG TPA: CRTAC1 family protein [Candidatus Saccharimonadales bacterium]|nr:CRTAC1 family protein [Candidatus Saccharimonadales bacterium]
MNPPASPYEEIPEEELVPEDDTIIGRAFRWSLVVICILAAAVAVGIFLSRRAPAEPQVVERGPVQAPPPLQEAGAEVPQVRFTDITKEAGIDFVHTSGARGEKLLPETMGAGVAFVDYDGDGDEDLVFVNSDRWPGDPGPHPTMALYRNDGKGHFENVTRGSGLDVSFYGMGIAAGDVDGDGRTDLFFTALGPNHLFLNRGGKFEEVTKRAGVAGEADRWSTSAGFFDYDGDGDLDLFVCNYVQWSKKIDHNLNFTLNGTDRAYGPPKQYKGTYPYLYRNDGHGVFTDVSAEAGIRIDNPATGQPMGKSLGVTFVDVDRDGRPDIFVSNDTVQNFLFRNKGDGTFEEMGANSGVGFDNSGMATGAMGIDAADFANDGLLGVGIANFANEPTSLYVQQRDPWQFVDQSAAEGIGSPSMLKLSFGLFFFDFDLDGRIDFFEANGHLEDEINQIQPSQHYRQPAQLFWNAGCEHRACFVVVPDKTAGDLSRPIVGRGAAYADIDGDGDLDVIVTQTGGAPLLLRNDQATGHHWLRVRLAGRAPNREAIGSRVELEAGGVKQTRYVMPTRSYLSQVELPVTFGLGDADRVDSLRVIWPGGEEQDVPVGAVDRTIVVEPGGTGR